MKNDELSASAERAVKWSVFTTMARFGLQLGSQIALARLLGPDVYGVYGIGMTVLTFVAFLSGASFSWNLMLLPKVTDEDIRLSFTWQMLIGVACAVAMWLAAPWIASFFSDPRVAGMVQLLAIASALTAASATATCLLQRELDFRSLGLIQIGSYAIGYLGVGVVLALRGYGATSLGVAAVVQAAVVLVATCAVRRHPVRPLLRHAGSDTLSTGRIVFFTNVVNWCLNNLDRVVIGRVLNTHSVGVYNLAYNVASIPNTLLVGAVQPTLLSTGAKLQDDHGRLGEGWSRAVAAVLVIATPMAVAAALLSHDLVAFVYGPAWGDAGWVLAALFLCVPAWASWGMSTPVLWNAQRKSSECLLQLPVLAVAAGLWFWAAHEGVRYVAAASVLVMFTRAAVMVVAVLRRLHLRWTGVGVALLRGGSLALLCGAGVLLGQHLAGSDAAPLARLLAGAVVGTAPAPFVLILAPQWLGRDALAVLSRMLPFLSKPTSPLAAAAVPGAS
ncbi:oligosaccharide flippase family protein [Ramlibacter ginsenosidimutans]|uniref:Oligosaccharide flippase family protein n=1 Tax=Ramlibacter ginsenosidimutans TaxID=502333 RepID=A0A934WLE6_9BURK|nr:oligosaccharide flippase family protein [Ramlibacter ginsenosidimutans]MBK6006694.1 oligosaccharide flippase family protein [Ramlibacter ginsenosidimutans]